MQLYIVLAGVVLLVLLIAGKVPTFLALLFSTLFTGLLAGMSFVKVTAAITTGVGSTMGSVALILVLGAIYGKLLEDSGVTQKIVSLLSGNVRGKNIQWAVLGIGIVVGIPLFYNAGFVILIPLVITLAAALRIPVLYIGLPMATALSVTHGFLPPHPGPTTLVGLLGANTGKTLLYGLIIGLPVAAFSGVFLTRLMVPYTLLPQQEGRTVEILSNKLLPGSGKSFLLALLPVLLITIGTIGSQLFAASHVVFTFLQEPVTAFLLSLIVLQVLLRLSLSNISTGAAEAIKGISVILLVIAAGGAFKQVLIDSGTAAQVAEGAKSLSVPPLVFGWLVAALLRLAIGSATVAAITAAGMVMPLMHLVPTPELMVLSVGAGSVFGSHVNDTGFWMFKEYFNITLKQTLRTWTVVETCISVLGLGGVLLLQTLLS